MRILPSVFGNSVRSLVVCFITFSESGEDFESGTFLQSFVISSVMALTFTKGYVLEQYKLARSKLPANQSPKVFPFVRQLLSSVPPELLIDQFEESKDWDKAVNSAKYKLEKLLADEAAFKRGRKELDFTEVSVDRYLEVHTIHTYCRTIWL